MKPDEIEDINRLSVLTVKQAARTANVATGTLYRRKEGTGPGSEPLCSLAENISGRSRRGTSIITAHCVVRARQRGYRHADFEMVQSVGTWMREGIFVRRRDVHSKLH